MTSCRSRAARLRVRTRPWAKLAARELLPSAVREFERERIFALELVLPDQRRRILPLPSRPAHPVCFLSLRLEQMPERRPAPVHGHLVPGHRGGGVHGQPDWHFSVPLGYSSVGLRTAL